MNLAALCSGTVALAAVCVYGLGAGAWIGTVMMLNVWLVMWPHQKKVLGLVPAPLEERVRCSRITFLSARTNTMLSIPLLFLMAAGPHALFLFD